MTRLARVGGNDWEHFLNVANTESNKDQFRVLVLEDDKISLASASRTILKAVPECVILAAGSLADGRRLLKEHRFHLCVLDIQLPDGSGIDFLYDIQLTSPDACVVILTGVPLPQYREQAEAFGVLHFMEKPADSRVLGPLVLEQWTKWNGAKEGNSRGFSGLLTQLTTIDIIQLKCLSRATVVLDFVGNQGKRGRIYFKDGEVIHAEAGLVSGIDAFSEIVGWRGGQVMEVTDAPPQARTVEGNWQGLLMHAVHWVDDQKQG